LWRIPLATLRGLATNPIIIGLLLGLGWNLSGLPLPGPLDRLTEMLAQAATAGALFALGAGLTRYRLAGNLGEPLLLVALKMLLQPLLVWLLGAHVLALPPLWTAVLVLLAALPTGVNAYLFAQRYEVGIATATTTVFLSTATGLVSLPLVLYLLG
ncbi:MAG: AEC family transporter, partial [Candidatus Competibacterales bacterium]|nr:AEC family transporter [Candidatus Competibacterales bacterium]